MYVQRKSQNITTKLFYAMLFYAAAKQVDYFAQSLDIGSSSCHFFSFIIYIADIWEI
jgi:hypothetical protein